MRLLAALPTCVALSIAAVPSHADYEAGAAFYAKRDYEHAFAQMLPAAADGSADAQFTVGVMYDVGQFVAVDKEKAVEWYRRAADQGQPHAQLRLATMLFNGEGTARDRKASYVWALLAAERLPRAKRADARGFLENARPFLGESQRRRARADAEKWRPSLPYVSPRPDSAPRRVGVGTGIFLNRDGALLTNLHVAFPCRQLLVANGDHVREAKVRTFDVALDLAVLATRGRPAASAVFKVGRPLAVGDAIGFTGYAPREMRSRAPMSTEGTVIALTDPTGNDDFFLTSAAVHPGQSGGPVTEPGGSVVGLIKGTGRQEPFSFAIAGTRIVAFLSRAKIPFQKSSADRSRAEPRPTRAPNGMLAFVECWR